MTSREIKVDRISTSQEIDKRLPSIKSAMVDGLEVVMIVNHNSTKTALLCTVIKSNNSRYWCGRVVERDYKYLSKMTDYSGVIAISNLTFQDRDVKNEFVSVKFGDLKVGDYFSKNGSIYQKKEVTEEFGWNHNATNGQGYAYIDDNYVVKTYIGIEKDFELLQGSLYYPQ